jgi:8-oxo-dGTP pyrophosphatase MutT (NUDIX family)
VTTPATPPTPLPAATVIICRPAMGSFEVLLVKRHGKSGFMAGAHVFPGGRVDPVDGEPGSEQAFVQAAIRETEEEAGITLDAASLRPYAWWITPAEEPKRFDTRFFLAQVPADTLAIIDEHEAVAFDWLTPTAALEAYADARLRLAPPTLCTLEDLQPFASPDEAARAVRMPLPAICPRIVTTDRGVVLALPGDPLHDEPAPVFQTRTRIVMDAAGRFSSARA